MKTRIVLPLLAVFSVLVLAAAIVFRPMPTSITQENAARIEPGMTYAQVVDIVGEMRDEIRGTEIPGLHDLVSLSGVANASWKSESAYIQVEFRKGLVREVIVEKTEFPSTVEYLQWRVRRGLGLSLHDEDE